MLKCNSLTNKKEEVNYKSSFLFNKTRIADEYFSFLSFITFTNNG